MSDDEADPELLELLRKSLGLDLNSADAPPETRVLASAEHIYNNSIDVAISMEGTKAAASRIYASMREKRYSTQTWSSHPLHPQTKDESTVNFIFTMDLLNFSFWKESDYAIEYKGTKYTGYWSLCAALRRALDEGLFITSPSYWHREAGYSEEVLRHIFRSASKEPMPMLTERIAVLREAADVLLEHFDMKVLNVVNEGKGSAARLVNTLANYFPNFRDEWRFEGKKCRLLKRAQIFVADLWACFDGESYGTFDDIDTITMFADYRIPQILHTLSVLLYSPPLESAIRNRRLLPTGSTWELEIRGCSIWAVELLRREIRKLDKSPGGQEMTVNAILIDFFLYDTITELERSRAGAVVNGVNGYHDDEDETPSTDVIPHHRTRSIWY